jgi:hypothetical protein
LKGNDFDKDYSNIPRDIFNKTYHEQELTDLAISTFIEHRARLAILKSAVDYRLYKNSGNDQNIKQRLNFFGLDHEYSLLEQLPYSFQKGLDEIAKHPYFHRYPIFWQWFMWCFGGFILTDYEVNEYELLSQKTGIPVAEIPNALSSYDILFPRNKGWLINISSECHIKNLIMFPTPFMGIGANYRRLVYGDGDFKNLKLDGKHTLNTLGRWHNILRILLG